MATTRQFATPGGTQTAGEGLVIWLLFNKCNLPLHVLHLPFHPMPAFPLQFGSPESMISGFSEIDGYSEYVLKMIQLAQFLLIT